MHSLYIIYKGSIKCFPNQLNRTEQPHRTMTRHSQTHSWAACVAEIRQWQCTIQGLVPLPCRFRATVICSDVRSHCAVHMNACRIDIAIEECGSVDDRTPFNWTMEGYSVILHISISHLKCHPCCENRDISFVITGTGSQCNNYQPLCFNKRRVWHLIENREHTLIKS